jgi:cytochrome c-type biogenesis protein CcmH/NrfG
VRLFFAIALAASLFWTACTRTTGLPAVGSEQYRDLCSAFYLGLTGLQSGEDINARKGLTRATEIAPGEPAGWADLGLLQFRQQDYEGAFGSVGKAQALAPDNSRLEALLGVIESRRGKTAETLSHLQRAVTLDSGNLKALYALAQETERQNSEQTDAEAEKLLQQILRVHPNNVAVLVDLVRLSAKRNDAEQLRSAVASLNRNASLWPDAAKQQLAALEQQITGPNVRPAAIQAQFLRNVLVRVPAYRQSLDEVRTPVTSAGEPFLKFLKLPAPSSQPSAFDPSVHFDSQAVANAPGSSVVWTGTMVPDDQHDPEAIWADTSNLHLRSGASVALPKTSQTGLLPPHAIATADLNYDFKTDLVMATDGGLRIYQQSDSAHFTDVTAKTKLPASVVNGSYTGAWPFDIDLDGDLDIVLGVPEGEPLVLRNNGDGAYTTIKPFKGVDGLTDFTSADVDGDGDPDVALLDRSGHLKIFANERLGDYRPRPVPNELSGQYTRLAAADMNGDGLPDFVLLRSDFHVLRLSDQSAGQGWSFAELLTAKPPAATSVPPTLTLADLDNNGALDLIINDQVYLSNDKTFTPLSARLPILCEGVLDLNGDGRLDIIGLDPEKRVFQSINRGTKAYTWQTIRPKAATTNGDQRINSFGIGGEMEIRAELLTQKQIIQSPVLHFGLGEHRAADFVRIVWPNGIIQTEFKPKPDQTLIAEQRLKGSCPLLFTWNGHKMQFVKDVAPMSAALGAHDGAGRFANITQTEEWFKISGDQLATRDGYYDLRVTDEYWETYYIDHYSLLSVDHPAGTQIFADERVADPPASLKIYVTGTPHPFATATDETGHNVSEAVRVLDGRYLDTFGRGSYQGIAHDHWVELELPPDAPAHTPLYLIGYGWLHPWDDGILVAVNQGAQAKPKDLSIEVPDRNGHWMEAKGNLGVPAGREKTVVLDLTNIFRPGAPRVLRLRTNLEIYWDKLEWAAGLPANTIKTQTLPLTSAELRHRGFSQVTQANSQAPEIPQYDHVSETGSKWRSLEGYYTRYGDVRPLLKGVDDRFVIANGGDELRMKFCAASPAPAHWSRDFIFIGDGWMKEGDYSFKYSTTVLPLPYHAMKQYTGPLTTLEDDKGYRLHPSDWQNFHTRYVTSGNLSTSLWK